MIEINKIHVGNCLTHMAERRQIRPTNHQPAINGTPNTIWREMTKKGLTRLAEKGIQEKSLMNIPHRFFIAMTDDLQFIQRNNINWWKRACMPSSAKDRWTVDFESIGFFTKNERYKFNQQLEPFSDDRMGNPGGGVRRYGGEDRNDTGTSLIWELYI